MRYDDEMHSSRPELGARLDHVALRSSDPERLASFLETAYGMQRFPIEGGWRCAAPQRTLLAFAGPANRTAWVAFAFDDATQLAAHRARLERAGIALRPNPSPLFAGVAHAAVDPEGNCVAFGVRDPQPRPSRRVTLRAGRSSCPPGSSTSRCARRGWTRWWLSIPRWASWCPIA